MKIALFLTKSYEASGLHGRLLLLVALALLISSNAVRAQEVCNEAEVSAGTCLSKPGAALDHWLEAYIGSKKFGTPPKVSKFFDRAYYLLEDIEWTPDIPINGISKVVVPKGFVTDFASVPRIFWPILPPDDEYLLPAIVHDWLYWDQSLSKEQADGIMKAAMEELKLASWKITAVYQAVSIFGGSAWTSNLRLKENMEKRILVIPPTDPAVRWEDYKKDPLVVR